MIKAALHDNLLSYCKQNSMVWGHKKVSQFRWSCQPNWSIFTLPHHSTSKYGALKNKHCGHNTFEKKWVALILATLCVCWEPINSFWHCDTILWHRSGSTFAKVMARCLMALSHYLNQWWLIISEVQWQSPENNFLRSQPSITKSSFKIIYLRFN